MRRILCVLIAASTIAAAAEKPRELKPGFNLFSKQQDVQLGREASAQIERQVRLVNNTELSDYVARIGRRLASQPQADNYPYTFKVVNDPNINAFALPGGPTYVNTGLITSAENEAQLAGVMAHEIAHVALRHGTNQASKANLIQLPAMLAGALAGNGSMLGQLTQLGIGIGAGSALMKFSRNAERDADLLGARMMNDAGYNPIEMARFFEKLQAKGDRSPAFLAFLSSHPDPGNRVKAVEDEIRRLPQRSYNADTGQFGQMRALVSRIPAERATGQGTAPARMPEIRPSRNYREFRGREFSIRYPDNWQTLGDSDGAMVTIAPPEGVHGPAIGFGAIASFYIPKERLDLRRHTTELIRQLQANNTGMRVGREGTRSMRVAGRAALITTLDSQSPYAGQAERDLLVTVEHQHGLFYVMFVAPSSEFERLQSVFEEMVQSVRFTG